MDCRPLEVIIDSANGLKDVNLFSKMDVYVVVSIAGDPLKRKQKTKTMVAKDGGTNPKWNSYPIKFIVDEAALLHNRLTLNIKLVSERTLGDTKIGKVKIPLKDLLDSMGGGDSQKKQSRHVSYSVRSSSGKPKGTINFGYKFGDKFSVPELQKKSHEPVMAYIVGHPGSSSGYPPAQAYPYPPPGAYPPSPHQQPGHGYAPPPQAGYAPPPQAWYGPTPQAWYGPPPQVWYGPPPQAWYGPPPQAWYGPPSQQVGQPQKPGGNMALGAGLVRRLLIGGMISAVGEIAYDAAFGGDVFGGGLGFW